MAKGREDMAGITKWIDVRATKQLLNAKKLANTEDVGNSWDNAKQQTKIRLSRKGNKYMRQIITGSIRPPHRLVCTGHCTTDACPYCNKEKCNAEHLFWDCEMLKDFRESQLKSMDKNHNSCRCTSNLERQLDSCDAK